jgi:hypothetical protein
MLTLIFLVERIIFWLVTGGQRWRQYVGHSRFDQMVKFRTAALIASIFVILGATFSAPGPAPRSEV